MPATQICVCPGVTSKKRDGVTRQRRCTRERRSTPLACHVLDVHYRVFAEHVQNVFRSLRCFLDEKHLSTSTWAGTDAHHPSSRYFLRPLWLLHEHQHVPSVAKFAAVEHTNFAKFLVQTQNARQETQTFKTQHRLLPTSVRFASFFLRKKSNGPPQTTTVFFCGEEEVFLRFPRVVFFMHVFFFFFENFCWVKTRSCMRLATSQSWVWTEQHQS